jgi:hypothetical protein
MGMPKMQVFQVDVEPEYVKSGYVKIVIWDIDV